MVLLVSRVVQYAFAVPSGVKAEDVRDKAGEG